MRIVVFGVGAVGGVIGGRLHQHADRHGHDVVCIARGAQYDAMEARGLRVLSPDGEVTVRVPVVRDPREITWTGGEVVILAMKTQDTAAALASLQAAAGRAAPSLAIACAQNGVESERLALRQFDDVYGICVLLPSTMLIPGEVVTNMTPLSGVLDIGRFPSGTDERAESIAAALRHSGFGSEANPAIMRRKYAKLLFNLDNAISAACGREARGSDLYRRARAEGVACLEAAGIDWETHEEEQARRQGTTVRQVEGQTQTGGSTWQSLARGTGSTEVDYLNGEIVLLGRLHGVPTPINAGLCRILRDLASRRGGPAAMTLPELEAELGVPAGL